MSISLFDHTGLDPNNTITNHTLTVPNYVATILSGGVPTKAYRVVFPVDGPIIVADPSALEIKSNTGYTLIYGVDWRPAYEFAAASLKTGKMVFAGISIINETMFTAADAHNNIIITTYNSLGTKYNPQVISGLTHAALPTTVIENPVLKTYEELFPVVLTIPIPAFANSFENDPIGIKEVNTSLGQLAAVLGTTYTNKILVVNNQANTKAHFGLDQITNIPTGSISDHALGVDGKLATTEGIKMLQSVSVQDITSAQRFSNLSENRAGHIVYSYNNTLGADYLAIDGSTHLKSSYPDVLPFIDAYSGLIENTIDDHTNIPSVETLQNMTIKINNTNAWTLLHGYNSTNGNRIYVGPVAFDGINGLSNTINYFVDSSLPANDGFVFVYESSTDGYVYAVTKDHLYCFGSIHLYKTNKTTQIVQTTPSTEYYFKIPHNLNSVNCAIEKVGNTIVVYNKSSNIIFVHDMSLNTSANITITGLPKCSFLVYMNNTNTWIAVAEGVAAGSVAFSTSTAANLSSWTNRTMPKSTVGIANVKIVNNVVFVLPRQTASMVTDGSNTCYLFSTNGTSFTANTQLNGGVCDVEYSDGYYYFNTYLNGVCRTNTNSVAYGLNSAFEFVYTQTQQMVGGLGQSKLISQGDKFYAIGDYNNLDNNVFYPNKHPIAFSAAYGRFWPELSHVINLKIEGVYSSAVDINGVCHAIVKNTDATRSIVTFRHNINDYSFTLPNMKKVGSAIPYLRAKTYTA